MLHLGQLGYGRGLGPSPDPHFTLRKIIDVFVTIEVTLVLSIVVVLLFITGYDIIMNKLDEIKAKKPTPTALPQW